MDRELDFSPPGSVGTTTVLVVGVLFLGVVALAGIVSMWMTARSLRAARNRERSLLDVRSQLPLSEGPSRVVHGRVEREGDQDVVAEVEIEQEVSNHSTKNGYWHEWIETRRSSHSRPFFLVHDGDERAVLVEAATEVLVVDALETSYPLKKPMKRLRAAKVTHGEKLYAYGDLFIGPNRRAEGRAYRDAGGTGFVMRAPRGGRLLLATEGMRDRYERRIAFLSYASWLLACCWFAFHVAFTLPVMAATTLGTVSSGKVAHTSSYVTHGKNAVTVHYVLTVDGADGLVVESEVHMRTFEEAERLEKMGTPLTVPMLRYGDGAWATYLGARAYSSVLPWTVGVMLALVVLGLVLMLYPPRFAWYDRKKLVEHGGNDEWIDPRPHGPVPPERN